MFRTVRAELRNVDLRWRWTDLVDAHDPLEYNWTEDDVLPGILEGAWDLFGDKVLAASFWVHVNFSQRESQGEATMYKTIPLDDCK